MLHNIVQHTKTNLIIYWCRRGQIRPNKATSDKCDKLEVLIWPPLASQKSCKKFKQSATSHVLRFSNQIYWLQHDSMSMPRWQLHHPLCRWWWCPCTCTQVEPLSNGPHQCMKQPDLKKNTLWQRNALQKRAFYLCQQRFVMARSS